MTTNWDRARIIVPHVAIVSVQLRAATLETDFDPGAPPDDLEPRLRYRADYHLPDSDPDRLDVDVGLDFEADVAGETVMRLTVTYTVIYLLEAAAQYPADALGHFAALNGVFNAWPYWRELVQTVTGRVGLPSVLVPVFNPAVVRLEEDGADDVGIAAADGNDDHTAATV